MASTLPTEPHSPPTGPFYSFPSLTSLKWVGKTFLAIGQGKIVAKQANPVEAPLVPICSKSSPHRMSCLKSKKNVPSSSNIRQELACKEECLVTLWVFICRLTRLLPSYYTSSSAYFPLAVARLTTKQGTIPALAGS